MPRMREIKNVVIMIIARPLRPWLVSGVQSYHQECGDIRAKIQTDTKTKTGKLCGECKDKFGNIY